MDILNLGSLNIDRVFRVPHIVAPGETLASQSLSVFAGGKGANQSVALARAGARVAHLGKVGADGGWLIDKLSGESIDTRFVGTSAGPTGQALIQVDDQGQNAIVLLGGANSEITPADVDAALGGTSGGTWLLAQNETSAVDHAIRRAKQLGRRVAFNPAPFERRVLEFPIGSVDLLCLNETEGAAMAGESSPEKIASSLAARWPQCEIVLTLGAQGALYRHGADSCQLDACAVNAVDTTAAGDTFLGYFLAARAGDRPPRDCLAWACRAAALCVTRPGAMDSIPFEREVQAFLGK